MLGLMSPSRLKGPVSACERGGLSPWDVRISILIAILYINETESNEMTRKVPPWHKYSGCGGTQLSGDHQETPAPPGQRPATAPILSIWHVASSFLH